MTATVVSRDTRDDLHNWARWLRAGSNTGTDYPSISAMFRDMPRSRADNEEPLPPIDSGAAEVTDAAVRALPEREQVAIAVHVIHACSTWAAVAEGMRKAGYPCGSTIARELVDRGMLGVEMYLRARAA